MNNDIVPGFDDEKNDSVKLKLQKIEGVEGGLIVYASGYLDTYNIKSFEKSIMKAIGVGFIRIVFEMSRINYLSSYPIGVFTQLFKTLKSSNGDLVFNNIQPKVHEVFGLLGLSQFFVFRENLPESIAYFSGHSESPIFPRIFNCPICAKRLRASKPGRFRCLECRTILVIDGSANLIEIGGRRDVARKTSSSSSG